MVEVVSLTVLVKVRVLELKFFSSKLILVPKDRRPGTAPGMTVNENWRETDCCGPHSQANGQ